ncbi:17641_t:CDS:2 [Cetraspora pellucida]|uniref:17641_t:CDS:1 n=1 Tax=Cetraspora pellucida TaxID=1433469 RepID=A0A9N9H9T4_9GLOM|nr:17641_t:CDS:2 [Cetraspora pellucida]
MFFILEENPSAPNEKDNALLRELQKKLRPNHEVEPLERLPFPPKFDEPYVEELKAIGRTYPMTEISKHIAELWKKEPEIVRKYYKELAIKAAHLHHEEYGNDKSSRVKKEKSKKPNQEPLIKPIEPAEPKGSTEPVPSYNEITYDYSSNQTHLFTPFTPYYNDCSYFYDPYSFIIGDNGNFGGYNNEECSLFCSLFCSHANTMNIMNTE